MRTDERTSLTEVIDADLELSTDVDDDERANIDSVDVALRR